MLYSPPTFHDRSEAAGKSRWYKNTRQPRVIFDPEASDRQTVLDVLAEDRTGLIYDISQAILKCGASIGNPWEYHRGSACDSRIYVVDKKTMAAFGRSGPKQREWAPLF